MEGQTTKLRIDKELALLKFDPNLFHEILDWVLCESIFAVACPTREQVAQLRQQPDGRNVFRKMLTNSLGLLPDKDIEALYERAKLESEKHFRTHVPLSNLLQLALQKKRACKFCGRNELEVKLHVDHIVPVSKGGTNFCDNLQFLCEPCNLAKGNKMEVDKPWLVLLER